MALEKRCAALTEKLKEQTEERAALSARVRANSESGNDGASGAINRASPELQTLLDSGADLNQINEELKLQQESIETYESLLEETTAELEAARDQVKFQREVQVNSDRLLEEFEAENEQLLADLSKSRANLAALQEQTANEARARAEDEEAGGNVPHAQVAEMDARLAAQSEELRAAQNRARRAEELVEESELMVQEESVLRAAAEAKLEAVVTEIEQEESRMLEEIELLKFSIEDKEGTHRRTLRNLNMEIELLRENEEALSLEIVRMKRSSAHVSAADGNDSLAAELSGLGGDDGAGAADAEQQHGGDFNISQLELQKSRREAKQLKLKMAQLEADLAEKSELLDKVVAKWTASVKQFISEANDPVAASRVPTGNGITPYLRGPEFHPDGSVTRDMRPRVWRGVVDTAQFEVYTQELSNPTLQVCADGNSPPLLKLCMLIERLFYHGFVTTPGFFSFSKRRDPWDFLAIALKSEEITKAVAASRSVTTSVGRFRLFVRWALVEQRLAEYVQAAFAVRPIVMKFYDQAALLWRLETVVTVDRALYALKAGNCTFSTMNPEVYVSEKEGRLSLDDGWPEPKKYVADL